MYVITGATGNTGRGVAEGLLSSNKRVRVVGRSEERLQDLIDKGAEPIIGSVLDHDLMAAAFKSATAAYIMIPPKYDAADMREYQNSVVESLAGALNGSDVSHVVSLSSVGAHMSDKVGPVNGLYDMEQRFSRLEGVNILHLRPSFFMENLMMQISVIKEHGIMGSPMRSDLSIPHIATRDIAAYATERLLKLDFSGKSVQELHGERDLTMQEITGVFGAAIGKPNLSYVQFPYEDSIKNMIDMGLSADAASRMVELSRSFNEGTVSPTEARSNQNTTPTSIEEFSSVFAAAFNA